MNYQKLFFIFSCIILIFSGVNYSIGPSINLSKYGADASYASLNCKKKSDDLERLKKKSYFKIALYEYEDYLYDIKQCRYVVGMFTMEYLSFNLNIVFGFIFLLVGFFSLQEAKIPMGNLISIICGIIGLLSTFTYVILSGTVFTQMYPEKSFYKRDSEGAFAEYEELKGYRCYYFSSVGDKRAFIAKYSDLIKSQYNYNKELRESFKDEQKSKCSIKDFSSFVTVCATEEYLKLTYYYDNCKKLYLNDNIEDKKYMPIIYDEAIKFLCVLIICIFLLPCYIALIFFAFNLSKDDSGYSQL